MPPERRPPYLHRTGQTHDWYRRPDARDPHVTGADHPGLRARRPGVPADPRPRRDREPRYVDVRVQGPPVAVATDGEVGPEGNHFLFRSRPDALGIYRPDRCRIESTARVEAVSGMGVAPGRDRTGGTRTGRRAPHPDRHPTTAVSHQRRQAEAERVAIAPEIDSDLRTLEPVRFLWRMSTRRILAPLHWVGAVPDPGSRIAEFRRPERDTMAVRQPLIRESDSPSHPGSDRSTPCATWPVGWSTSTPAHHDRFLSHPPERRIPIHSTILWSVGVVVLVSGLALSLLGSTAHRRHSYRSDHRPTGGSPQHPIAP
jgi:hypothetical protein